MINVPALFARLSTGILAIAIMVCVVQADTVVQVNLNGYVPGIFGDQVSSYQIQLFDNEAPITVANYLKYVNNNAYNNTIIHRDVPGFIIQGGGFKTQVSNNTVTGLTPIPTYGTIQNEFDSSRSNVRGTIAMAKLGSDPNSATSQWFINLADNSSNLDSQNGGFTVFGQVAGEGMTLVDAVAGLPTYNLNSLYDPSGVNGSPFSEVPLAGNGSIFVTVLSMNVVSTVAWKGGASSASTDWGTLANWGSGTSVPNGAGVNLSIGSQASANNVIDLGSANRTVGNIYFTSGTGTTIQSTNGYSLIIDNSGKTSLINVIGDHTISAPMILNNNTIIDIDGSMAISGAISGSGSVALNNSGGLTLTGTNTYTGNTLITAGSLSAAQAASLPGYNTSGKVTVSSGAALIIKAGASTGEWVESEINSLQSNAVFNSGSYLAIDTSDGDFSYGASGGILGGSLSLAKLGDNSLLLTGSNTYSGNTEAVAGVLTVGMPASLPGYNSSGKISVDPGATLAVRAGAAAGEWTSSQIDTLLANATFNTDSNSNTVSYFGIDTTGGPFSYGSVIGGTQGLNKLGSNTLTLTGANTFTGPVNFTSGLINATALNNLGAGSELDFNGGGLQFNGVFDPSTRTMSFQADAIIDTQGLTITFANPIGNGGDGGLTKMGTGTLILTGANTFNGAVNFNAGLINASNLGNLGNGSELNFNGGGLQFGAAFDVTADNRTITFQTGNAVFDTQTYNVTLANSIGNGGDGGLTKQGSGMLTLSASPDYNGTTVINAGTLQLASGATLPATTAVSLTASGAKLDANGISQTIASLTGVAGTEVKLGGSTLTTGDNTSTTFAGIITSASGGSLTKTGSGTFTLTGSNTFSGAVNFNAGLINAAALSNLGNAAALSFNGGGLQFAAAFDPSSDNRTITFQAGGATLDTQANNITVSKGIFGNAGAGGLTKNGSGILELDGTVTYSGATAINAGVLKINNKQSTTLVAVSGAGTLEVDGASTVLTASSVNVNTLTIGAGSVVVIAAIPGGPPIGQQSGLVPLPEPSALVLLGIGALAMLYAARRKR
jgi:autotransporter-associated beta strand protein